MVALGLIAGTKIFAAAGVPRILNYQGRLLDASGILLGESGTEFCFKFSFYDDAAVGAPDNKLWPAGAPSTMTVLVKNGVFDAGIGDTLSGGDILDFDFQSQDEIYVNTEVAQKVGVTCAPGDGAEVFENLSPRQRVVSSGYSINSDTLDGFHAAPSASGNQIPVLTGGNLFLGALTPQINATSSNSLTIQGNALSGNLLLNPLSGFVGIGTTSPSQLLSVHGNALFLGNITSVADITATGNLSLIGASGTSTIASGQGFTVGASQFVVQQGSGDIGIGTADPGTKVGIGGAGSIISFIGTAGGASEGIQYLDSASKRRFGLIFPGSDIVALANRTSNGVVQIRANTGTAGPSGEVTAAEFQDDKIIFNNGNVGIGTTSPLGLLSVNPDGINGPAFVVGSSTATLFSITQSGIGNLDFSRVTVGGPTKEDQLYVYGRINSSWRGYQREWLATCAPLAVIVADTADICGLVFDEDADGAVIAKVAGSSAIRLRASTAGSLAVGEGAILGSGGPLPMNRDNNPVMEARVMPLTLTNHRIEAGFAVRALNGDIAADTNGVYFRATPASSNWIAVNRAGGSEVGSVVDTGVAISTANFQELRVEINGSVNTRFFIGGVLVATISLNIPTADLGFSVGNALITTADAVKNLDVESIKVWIDDPPEGTSGEMATTSEDNPISEIQTAEVPDSGLGDIIRQTLNSLGLFIENGIAKFQEFIAEKAIIKSARIQNLDISEKIQLRDQATNEFYCTWLENGEWKKVLGTCENISVSNSTTTNFVINKNATTTQNSN